MKKFRFYSTAVSTVLVLIGVLSSNGANARSDVCIATGEPCSLGIDPDIYQMPLFGEYIQKGDELICATTNWSPFPPEVFDIDFMRNFWAYEMNPTQQAEAEAASIFFVSTHHGQPTTPPADLADVATPGVFADEVVSGLDARTTRIEFEVPKTDFEKLGFVGVYVPFVAPPDPAPDVPLKLRGWYIKGDGIFARGDREHGGGRSRVEHPLIILSTGFPYSIAYDSLVGGVAVGRQIRKTITYFVAKGFDVLIFDKRGHGYSEGLLDGMGEDVFRALDQLEHGRIVEDGIELTLTIIGPDGERLQGAAAASKKLLGKRYTARTKPILLRGFSYGSSQLQKAMAMNYSDLPVEYRFKRDDDGDIVVDPTRMPPGNRGYNFRGIIAISGFQGSIKYETVPYFLALDAHGSAVGHNGGILKSSVYESMDRWPAFLGLYSTNDFETADGAVDAYNERLRGIKDIKMVTGYHFGLASEEVDTWFAYESVKFARRALVGPVPEFNTRTTTYAEEVCKSEHVTMDPATQSIVDVPSKRIRRVNRRVNRFIAKWLAKQSRIKHRQTYRTQ